LSVLSIIAFHTGLNSVRGGFYGVDSFFVLSGFLITSLLVREWNGTGTIKLCRFWASRARRLLPALFLLVAVIGIVLGVVPTVLATPHVLGDALSTIFYVSNWYSIHGGVTYFALSTQPSPLLHTWSLAIEEQFYVVWPLVVLAVLRVGTSRQSRSAQRRAQRKTRSRTVAVLGGGQVLLVGPSRPHDDAVWTRRRRLHMLFVVACVGSLASALLMVVLAPNGYTTRAYYGTDTRAQALLVGAAIAIGLTLWRDGSARCWFTRMASLLALVGVAGTAALWATTSETSTFAFSGGFLVASLAAGAVVLGCAVAPRSVVVRLLELPPLPQWGRISYGVYLWYWPVLLIMTGQRLHWGVYPLFLARVGVTVAIAALSHDLVEMPIRRGALRRWRSWVAAPIGAAAAIAAVFASTLMPVGAAELRGSQLAVSAPTSTTSTVAVAATPSPGAPPSTTTTTSTMTPSYLSPAPPVTTSTKMVKVLLVGDSVAGTLGVGLAQEATQYNVQIANEGMPGCSLSMQTQIKVLFYSVAPQPPCDADNNPNSLLDTWRTWVDAYNPDVVVYLARGETFDQEVGGQWQNIGQTAFDAYLANRYRQAISVLGSKGADIVLLTSPYYDSGASPAGTPWPEDNPARVTLDNEIMRQIAAATPAGADGSRLYVFDLNADVSPTHVFSPTVNHINVRCGDGVHFTQSGGIYVGQRLAPELAALGQMHAVGSPGGGWPGPLPPSTPSWFTSLPCQ
jgi:peptidoglycan/LPS O-acetylase OafA/YrhL